MKILTDLLERFFQSLNKDRLIRENILRVIKEKTGTVPEKINLKEGILEVSARPALRNEIKLKEAQILNELKNVSRIIYK